MISCGWKACIWFISPLAYFYILEASGGIIFPFPLPSPSPLDNKNEKAKEREGQRKRDK